MGLLWILIITIVLIIIVIGAVMWAVKGHNNLVHSKELCGNAMSQIGVQQASRWDALSTLADLTKQYSDQEHSNLMDTIHARQSVDTKSSSSDVEKQESMLQQGLGSIDALSEAYPELKSNVLYKKTMDEVKSYEDNVRMSRMVYNDTVTKYNRLVCSYPGAWLAGSLGFAPYEYLQDEPSKAEMPTMKR